MRSLKPVRYGPGLSSVTSIPCPASSARMALPIASSACLVIEYGPNDGPDDHTGDRRHDDDAAGALGDHARQHLLGDRERAEHVDVEEAPYPVERHVGHRTGLAGARVVDQHVDVPLGGLGDVGRGDVELLDGELRRLGAQRRGLLLGLGGGDHVVASLRQRQAGALAEPRTGTGDHYGLRHDRISCGSRTCVRRSIRRTMLPQITRRCRARSQPAPHRSWRDASCTRRRGCK